MEQEVQDKHVLDLFWITDSIQTIVTCVIQEESFTREGRQVGMNPYKERFANPTDKRTLEDAFKGCDIAIGLS